MPEHSTVLTICMECDATNRVEVESGRKQAPVCGKCKKSLAFENFVSHLGAPQLKKLSERAGEVPVVANFWAPWDQSCQAFGNIFERVAARHAGTFMFVKVDTQAHPLSNEAFRIHNLPTIVLFRNGLERGREEESMREAAFEDWIMRTSRF